MRSRNTVSVILASLVISISIVGYSDSLEGILLENKNVKFVFDTQRGGLISLLDKATGVEFCNDRGVSSLIFRITIVDPSGKEVILSNLDAESFEYHRVEFPDKSALVLIWRDIGTIKTEVRCTIILPSEGTFAEWYIDIKSQEKFRLRSVEFPCFNTISSVGPDYKDDQYLYPCQEGVIMPRSSSYLFRLNFRPDCLFYPGD